MQNATISHILSSEAGEKFPFILHHFHFEKSVKHKNSNPVAIITGGAKRLGREISYALAVAGFDVVISYRTSQKDAATVLKLIESVGRKCYILKANVTHIVDVKKIISTALQKFGRIDILINNAAIFPKSNLTTTTEKIWDKTFSTNLKSIFLTSKEVAPVFKKQNCGQIINLSSVGGIEAWKNHLPYSVAKAGVIHLTKILAKELAPFVRVNSVAPGLIYFENENANDISKKMVKKIPLQRQGKPEDISSLIVYLATTARYITGQTFIVDGGKTL